MDQIEDFVRASGLDMPSYDVCFFGGPEVADAILDSVLRGKKCANTGLQSLYDGAMEPLPKVGDYSIIVNSAMEPKCITRITKVEFVTFENITEEYAAAEGEMSLADWKEKHRKYFEDCCREVGITFSEQMHCVCEYFEVVYRKSMLK